ncbi:hypothetical protein [Actinokineospora auranticolor]|uniref:hypothetical protein n=1 Tax=Actinokineospora auranticolor TaxID=155976 RepID=UPI003CCC38EC
MPTGHICWETEEHFQAWLTGSAKEAHSGERAKPVGTGSDLLEFEIVQSTGPKA